MPWTEKLFAVLARRAGVPLPVFAAMREKAARSTRQCCVNRGDELAESSVTASDLPPGDLQVIHAQPRKNVEKFRSQACQGALLDGCH